MVVRLLACRLGVGWRHSRSWSGVLFSGPSNVALRLSAFFRSACAVVLPSSQRGWLRAWFLALGEIWRSVCGVCPTFSCSSLACAVLLLLQSASPFCCLPFSVFPAFSPSPRVLYLLCGLGFPWLFSSSLSRSARLVRLRSPPPAFLTSPPDSLRFCRPLRRPFFVLLRASAAAGVLDGVIRILGWWSFASFQYSRSHRVCMRCALRRGS